MFRVALIVLSAIVVSGSSAHAANLSMSQSSVGIPLGQSTTVTIAGGSGSYFVSGNSSQGSVQANINGSALSLGLSGDGSGGTVTVCDAITPSTCGTVTITNGSGSNNNSSASTVSFNPSSVSVPVGSIQTVTISGNGTYFISSGANSTVASVSLSGNVLSVTGIGSGGTSATICQQSGGGCNSLSITVGTGSVSGALNFSQSNPSVSIGQIMNISISGGSNVFSLSNNSNPNGLTATINGTSLTITGKAIGSAVLTICSSSGPCGSLSVNITGTTASNTTVNTTTNTNSIPASFALTLLTQIQSMESQLSQFSSQLAQLKTSIQNLINGNFGATNTGTTSSVGAGMNLGTVNSYRFTIPLSLGDSGTEVTELQKRLLVEGVYSGEITGYFGPATEKSVKAYQTKHGLTPLGNVGPGTRAELNK